MEEISIALMNFIRTTFRNIEQLRIFLALRKTSDQLWRLDTLSATLYVPPEQVDVQLKHLAEKGFVRYHSDESFQYNPVPRLEHLCGEVVQLDLERPVTLIRFIYNIKTGQDMSGETP